MEETWEDCEELLNEIIKENNIDSENRIGLLVLWAEKNIGDMYFLAASLTYAQKVVGKRCVIIAPKSFTIQKFISWHNSNGADIEFGYISETQLQVLRHFDKEIRYRYNGKVDVFDVTYNRLPVRQVTTVDVYSNLTRPKFPSFNRDKYIDKYGVVPGKTIFVIPEAKYHGTFPLYFWIMSIEIFKMLGFKVIVNAKEGTSKYGDVLCSLIPLDDIVSFCDLCGMVYSIRTGLAEFLASEVKAKMYIFTLQEHLDKVFRSVQLIYPHIDNCDGHITEIPIPMNKQEFSWIRNISDTFNERMNILCENALLKEKIFQIAYAPRKTKMSKPSFYNRRYGGHIFMNFQDPLCPRFCTVSYEMFKKRFAIYFVMDIRPLMNYEIHIALKDKQSNKIVSRYEHYNNMDIVFDPPEDGEYCAVVHIIHPETGRNCLFETDTVSLYRTLKEKLIRCRDFHRYVVLLNENKQDLIIFVTSKDAHTNYRQDKKVDLGDFKISTDLMHTFRYSWLCVIDSGEVVKEMSSENKGLSFDYKWNDNRAHITSAGYNVNHNDKCSVVIKINNEQLCVDQRGLNFVVWDKRDNRLLDSVCFDTYYDGYAARL